MAAPLFSSRSIPFNVTEVNEENGHFSSVVGSSERTGDWLPSEVAALQRSPDGNGEKLAGKTNYNSRFNRLLLRLRHHLVHQKASRNTVEVELHCMYLHVIRPFAGSASWVCLRGVESRSIHFWPQVPPLASRQGAWLSYTDADVHRNYWYFTYPPYRNGLCTQKPTL